MIHMYKREKSKIPTIMLKKSFIFYNLVLIVYNEVIDDIQC